MSNALLSKLQITDVNPGACLGPGGWLTDPQGKAVVSINPTTGSPIASVLQASPECYQQVMGAASAAFLTWRETPAPKRGEVVRDLGNALREMKEPLGDLVSLEMGKIRAEGHGEVQEMIDICDFAVGLSRQLYGLTMASERPAHRMMEQWHPLGVVGLITSFNFPVAVWAWNTAIAAVCGDPVVWKPSGYTPLCGIAVQHIANRVAADHGLKGVFTLAIGAGRHVGELMLTDHRLPLISFTGSTSVGQHVAEVVARRFGRTILELGGNNAIIVTEDANLDMATRAILFGAVGTAGQRCTSTRRIIAHRSIARELTDRLVKAYAQVSIGDPLAEGTLMGPLVVADSVDEMMQAIEQARAEGGEVLCGGRLRPDLGPQFVEPAIVRMPAQTEIVKRETFAPVLYVLEYEEFSEALRLHNDVPQGLSSAIFTESVRKAEEFLSPRGSDCGIANVNIGTSGAEIGGAFGGEKETGGGRESGSDAWKAYMRRQTNTVNWSNALPLAQGIKFGD
ncbi:MAG: aldehyde dehydrogenase family protein [Vicinamibacteraceae bacterium]|nr:aldehyde dehydrogenase family protein [Vicinamibacteraceae bacterium]MCL4846202.1 aldehyde dehydrogenase family protein [Acidobacteriota bacterium]